MNWLSQPATETQIPHRARLWLYAAGILIMIFLVVPTLLVIPMSFSASQYLEFPPREWSLRWYRSYFGSASWMQATWTSLKAGLLTALIATGDLCERDAMTKDGIEEAVGRALTRFSRNRAS